MKMTDTSDQDECYIEMVIPAKKKKLKQAQLPFQIKSTTQSPNIKKNKKRKLTSPSVTGKGQKSVKVARMSLKRVDDKVDDKDTIQTDDGDEDAIENIEIENIKENAISNTVNSVDKSKTPKRASNGQKKLEKQERLQSNSLTKFLAKADEQEDSSKDGQCSLVKSKDKSMNKSIDKSVNESIDTESDMNISLSSPKLDASLTANDVYDVDSDTINISTDTTNYETGKVETSEVSKTAVKKLSPSQQEKKLLKTKKKEERLKQRTEKEKKLEEERDSRRREKEEKRREKEEKLKAEREQKLLNKKMKEERKQQEIEQRQKEKKAKEEERRKREEAKEEEKRKKEEEKLEAERKKQKAASNFTSFFVAKKQEKSFHEEASAETKNFMPFEIKADMKIAPVCRRILTEEEKLSLDAKYEKETTKMEYLYLNEIKEKKIVPRKSARTWLPEAKDDIILLDENEGSSNIVNQNIVVEKHRPKLLQFSENRRPPYWGTWRKRSRIINSRRPFATDTKWFNYEVDSDDEWEEEEPGESLHGSDEEKAEENPDDDEYDVDNEFMVPHGYLSDEELRAHEEDVEDMNPETQKLKLKVLGQEFESERNMKTSKLKPKIIGCVWKDSENQFPPNLPQRTIDFLSAREAWTRQIPVILPTTSECEAINVTESGTPTQQQAPTSSKKFRVPEAMLPDLIRLVHGNQHGRVFLVKEFIAYMSKHDPEENQRIPKSSVMKKICEIGKWIACPDEGPMHMKSCWYVSEEIRKKYIEENLPLPNQWTYTLTPKRRSIFTEIVDKPDKEDKDKEKKPVSLITQFTKKITQEEMKKQLNSTSPTTKSSPSSSLSKTATVKSPKRATLISVSRGEQFPRAILTSLDVKVSDIKKEKDSNSSKDSNKNKDDEYGDDDDVIILDSSNDEQDDQDANKKSELAKK